MKRSVFDKLDDIEQMVKLLKYEYECARKRHTKIELNPIFINSLIAHTRDLINEGYSSTSRRAYPALYVMEDKLPN